MPSNQKPHTLGWGVFAAALVDHGRQEAAVDGIKALIQLYYADYTEGTQLDHGFRRAILSFQEWIADEEIEDVIRETEREIHAETGRDFVSLHEKLDEEDK